MESFEMKELMKAVRGMVADMKGGPFFEVSWIGKKREGAGFMLPPGLDAEFIGDEPGERLPKLPPEEELFPKPRRRMIKRGDVNTAYEHEKGTVIVLHGSALIVSDSYERVCGFLVTEAEDGED